MTRKMLHLGSQDPPAWCVLIMERTGEAQAEEWGPSYSLPPRETVGISAELAWVAASRLLPFSTQSGVRSRAVLRPPASATAPCDGVFVSGAKLWAHHLQQRR